MPPNPADAVTDPARLAAVAGTNLLDTPPEASFDRLARLAARLLAAPVALISLVAADRQFVKACTGLPEPWATTAQGAVPRFLCEHLVATGEPLHVDNAAADPPAGDGPALVAHVGVPLVDADGHVLGGLLVSDTEPREWAQRDLADLRDVAELVMAEVQAHVDLVERQRARLRVDHGVDRLRRALDASGDVVIVATTDLDPDGPRIVHANEAAGALLGRRAQELEGMSLRALWGPGLTAAAYRSLASHLALGTPWSGEIRQALPGDPTGSLRWRVSPLRDQDGRISHWVATQENQLARDALLLHLEETEASFQDLLERVPAVVYTLEPGSPNNITYVSPQVEPMFGERPEDCVGSADMWDRLVHPADRERVTAHCEHTNATGAPFLDEYRLRFGDGRVRWVRDESVLVHDQAGRPRFWQGILTDITERKQAEAIRKQLLARLISAQEDERRRVADDVHDDTIQALAAAIMELQLVGPRVEDPTGQLHLRRALESLRRSLQSARTLVFNLRPPLLDSGGLGPAIGQQLEELTLRTGCSGELDWDGGERLDAAIEATVFRTVQEALTNVAKHARARHVLVRGRRSDELLTVEVRDDGVGFVVGESPAAAPRHLGLRAMAERTEMVGGRFDVDAGPDRGTAVTIQVPIRRLDQPTPPAGQPLAYR